MSLKNPYLTTVLSVFLFLSVLIPTLRIAVERATDPVVQMDYYAQGFGAFLAAIAIGALGLLVPANKVKAYRIGCAFLCFGYVYQEFFVH